MGDNIGGPSVIRLPAWADRSRGEYALYFADHRGSYLRIAYADRPEGPWRVHEAGCLDVSESLFCTESPNPATPPPYWRAADDGWRAFLYPHVASPDVHVLEAEREIRLYFHGLLPDGDQLTRLAISRDGLHFAVREPLLAPPYLRAFRHRHCWYGLAWPNRLWRSGDGLTPFAAGPALLPELTRHTGLLVEGERLHLLWTQTGEAPERIYHGVVELRGDWRDWRLSSSEELLRPELAWEDAGEPAEVAELGAADGRVNQLRDPFLFRDGARLLLYYAGGGERGIGLAECRL